MVNVSGVSCGQQARMYSDVTVEDLAGKNNLQDIMGLSFEIIVERKGGHW